MALVCAMGFTDMSYLPEAQAAIWSIRNIISESASDICRDGFGYLNYADVHSSDQENDHNTRKAYGPNYPRLQALKRKYDPEMIFNRWFRIKPADAPV